MELAVPLVPFLGKTPGCVRAPRSRRVACRASANAEAPALTPLPLTARDMVAQASVAVKEAIAAGVRRQKLELLLPIDQRKACFTNTDSLDYPISANEVYAVAGETASLLLQLVSGRNGAVVKSKRIDDDGDPCGVFFLEDQSVAAVVLPTAERLQDIRDYAENKSIKTLIIINPQWNDAGQVISVFGIGPWKKAAEDFLSTFQLTYSLTEKRIGAPSTLGAGGRNAGMGGVARVLRALPGNWQVFAMGGDGSSECVVVRDEVPTYQFLETIFTKAEYSLRNTRKGEVSQEQALKDAAGSGTGTAAEWSVRSVAEVQAAIASKAIVPDAVALLDKPALRAALTMFKLPTSGKLDDLRGRLKVALEEQIAGKRAVSN